MKHRGSSLNSPIIWFAVAAIVVSLSYRYAEQAEQGVNAAYVDRFLSQEEAPESTVAGRAFYSLIAQSRDAEGSSNKIDAVGMQLALTGRNVHDDPYLMALLGIEAQAPRRAWYSAMIREIPSEEPGLDPAMSIGRIQKVGSERAAAREEERRRQMEIAAREAERALEEQERAEANTPQRVPSPLERLTGHEHYLANMIRGVSDNGIFMDGGFLSIGDNLSRVTGSQIREGSSIRLEATNGSVVTFRDRDGVRLSIDMTEDL